MRKITRNFLKMNPAKLIIFGQNVEAKMTRESGIFPSPTPSIGDLTSMRLVLEEAVSRATKGGLTERQLRDALCEQYKSMLMQLSLYVTLEAGGQEELMERSGFTLSKIRTKMGIPEEVTNLSIKHPGFSGELSLRWRAVYGAKSYTIQYKAVGDAYWNANNSTRVSTMISFLEPHKEYVFRVAAIGSAGMGPWSDEVPAFVL